MSNPSRRAHWETKRKGKGKQQLNNSDYGEVNSEEDPLKELTRPQLLEINRVFNAIVSGNPPNPQPTTIDAQQDKPVSLSPKQAQQQQQDLGGDFIVEDQETSAGGGFLVEDQSRGKGFEAGGFLIEETGTDVKAGEEAEADSGLDKSINHGKRKSSEHGHQSISPQKVLNYMSRQKVPEALKMLNLPYRNSDISSIFENAASSDEEDWSDRQSRSINPKEKLIGWIKFSKVCVVLMVANGDDDDNSGMENNDYQPDPPPHGTSTRSRPRTGTQSLQTRTSPTSKCAPLDVVLSKACPQRRQAKGKKAKCCSEAEGGEDGDDESAMQSSHLTPLLYFFSQQSGDLISAIIRLGLKILDVRQTNLRNAQLRLSHKQLLGGFSGIQKTSQGDQNGVTWVLYPSYAV
ncbi:hypothetical protein PSHT_15477 [Puccinia striiformis]|uniref:Uncharacterized protein n=1 Tax=Puccinia striiformis TaxID=27350 RepID=A0A2S4UEW2_9BASI|nr:hypothetical protein PSHT_15477 [Puccinia striiformis]